MGLGVGTQSDDLSAQARFLGRICSGLHGLTRQHASKLARLVSTTTAACQGMEHDIRRGGACGRSTPWAVAQDQRASSGTTSNQ